MSANSNSSLARRVARKLLAPLRSDRTRKIVSRVQRRLTPIGADDLRRGLDVLIDVRPDAMMMHSSLSACGQFRGGAEAALDVLAEYCGNLCLPTHTYCYPAELGEPGPIFDARQTPSKNGLLTDVFWRQPQVLRSVHATHSLAVKGPKGQEIAAGHHLNDSPCGEGTPYSRLVHSGAAALMLGVHFHYYTFFHTAEFEAGSSHADQQGVRDLLRARDVEGQLLEWTSRRQNWAPMRFKEAGDLLEKMGLVRRAAFGRSTLLFAPDTLKVHDFLVERLRKTPDFLRASCTTPLN